MCPGPNQSAGSLLSSDANPAPGIEGRHNIQPGGVRVDEATFGAWCYFLVVDALSLLQVPQSAS